jgi:hypothetical protein
MPCYSPAHTGLRFFIAVLAFHLCANTHSIRLVKLEIGELLEYMLCGRINVLFADKIHGLPVFIFY